MICLDSNNSPKPIGLESPLKHFIKAGYNIILPEIQTKRNGYSATLYYILSGNLDINVNGQVYKCKENSIIHLSKDDSVTIYNPSQREKAELYYLLFDLSDGITMDSVSTERVTDDKDGEMYRLCKNIYKAYLAEGVGYNLKIVSDFVGLLYMLKAKGISTEENVDYKLSKAVSYIKMNYYKNLSVEALADISGYSVSHFRRLFVNAYGVSPQEYMLNFRIGKAKELLLEEKDKSIEEIAEILGMCNASYFCRLFKEKTGVSPHKYKTRS